MRLHLDAEGGANSRTYGADIDDDLMDGTSHQPRYTRARHRRTTAPTDRTPTCRRLGGSVGYRPTRDHRPGPIERAGIMCPHPRQTMRQATA